ncbi:MAG: hypothetical protein KJ574_03770 [Nanoarchaeota archaeon]|nr:hypothetical protein [Nanoarchaeota archaeon]
MEDNLKIPTNDGHLIYGTLNYINKEPKRLIIFVHGLSDNKDHRTVFNAARYFKTQGFHTFRFSLYSDDDKARVLEDCSIGTFVEDINSVIYYFKGKFDEIFLACHSLGFVVLDCDLEGVKSIALWDPSLSLKEDRIETLRYEPAIHAYFINWGISFIIGKQLKIDWENINDERLLRNVKTPLCILMAEDSNLKIGWKSNLKYLNVEHEYHEIKGASHDFVEEGTEEKLFEETLEWFNK